MKQRRLATICRYVLEKATDYRRRQEGRGTAKRQFVIAPALPFMTAPVARSA
jgi:hypothetical protein